MDVQQIIQWVQDNVGEQTSKQELVQKSQSSNLPDEAKSAFQQLPEGQHSKQDVISQIQQKFMAGVGGGGGGMGGIGGFGGGSGGGFGGGGGTGGMGGGG